MRLNKITTAIAAVTLASSAGVVVADAHSTNVVSNTPITVAGEIFGGWTNSDRERTTRNIPDDGFGQNNDNETTNFGTGVFKLSIEAQLAENLTARAEVRFNDDDPNRTADTDLTDLYIQYDADHGDLGATAIRAGQYKPRLDGNLFQEETARPFVSDAGSSLNNLLDVSVMRRVSGIGADWSWSAGTFSSVNVWNAGDEDEVNNNTTGNIDRFDREDSISLGYSLRAGWVGNIADNVQAGFAATYLDMTFEEDSTITNDVTTQDDEEESDAYNLEAVVKVANFVFSASYADGEWENKEVNVGSTFREKTESSAWVVQGIWNIKGADRGISSFGEIEGPSLAAGEKAYEVALRIGNEEYDYSEFQTGVGGVNDVEDGDTDSWALVGSMWCGSKFRTYLEIANSDEDFDDVSNVTGFGSKTTDEVDRITFGFVANF